MLVPNPHPGLARQALAFNLTATALAVVLGVSIPLGMTPQFASMGWVALVVGLLLVARFVFGGLLVSPVMLVSLGLAVFGVAGRLLYPAVADAPGGAAISLHLSRSVQNRTFDLISVVVAGILLGALAFALITGRLRPHRTAVRALELTDSSLQRLRWLVVVPLVMLFGSGPSLWRRSVYIQQHVGQGAVLPTLGAPLGLVAVAALGYLWVRRYQRLFVVAATFGYWLAFFGSGSRRMALVPVLFALGAYAARTDRRGLAFLVAGSLLSFYLVGLPVELRSLPAHGILPYANSLPELLSAGLPTDVTSKNILVGFPITGATAFIAPRFPIHDIFVSLNPLPGSMVGWYQIAAQHRLNAYTPYAGLGELGNAGIQTAAVVAIGIGILLAYVDFRVKALAERNTVAALVLMSLSGLFLLFLTQYNLRSGLRLLYFALLLAMLLPYFFRRRRQDALYTTGTGQV